MAHRLSELLRWLVADFFWHKLERRLEALSEQSPIIQMAATLVLYIIRSATSALDHVESGKRLKVKSEALVRDAQRLTHRGEISPICSRKVAQYLDLFLRKCDFCRFMFTRAEFA